MYTLNDTIVAVGSPTLDQRVIVRISGPEAIQTCNRIYGPDVSTYIKNRSNCVLTASVLIGDELKIDSQLYLFFSPHSYTGEDIAEIHIFTNKTVTSALIDRLLSMGLRTAGPGEFTARAYLNGKIDLVQAEAVNEIIISSNTFQLNAAEKLLSGRLSQTIKQVRSSIMEILSLIEAGLDFSEENIEFISPQDAIERLEGIEKQLEDLQAGSINYESVIDLPSVGIAGAPNAGKSSLANSLLGTERSIVSDTHKTTRDVLTGLLELEHSNCVLFDCAGLIIESSDIIDELAQQAAIEALQNSSIVIFCVDISKSTWDADIMIRKLVEPQKPISIATKCDLLLERDLVERLAILNDLFGADFEPVSSKTGTGIDIFKKIIDEKLIEKFKTQDTGAAILNSRHKQAVNEAIENINESIREIQNGNDEAVAMMLRAAYQAVSDIVLGTVYSDQSADGHIDEQILDQIFGKFCIGK